MNSGWGLFYSTSKRKTQNQMSMQNKPPNMAEQRTKQIFKQQLKVRRQLRLDQFSVNTWPPGPLGLHSRCHKNHHVPNNHCHLYTHNCCGLFIVMHVKVLFSVLLCLLLLHNCQYFLSPTRPKHFTIFRSLSQGKPAATESCYPT